MAAKVALKVGPVSATFAGTMPVYYAAPTASGPTGSAPRPAGAVPCPGRSHQTPSRDAEAARFDVTLSTPAKMARSAQASISTGCLQRLSNTRDRNQKSTFLRLVFRRSSLIGCDPNVLEAEIAAR